MNIDNINDFIWKCYTEEGNIEINNDSNYQDNNLVDIIEELYSVLALEKMDSNQENSEDEKTRICWLEKMNQKHNILLRLKQIYYTEVQESIDRINHHCECRKYVEKENIYICEELQRTFINYYKHGYLLEKFWYHWWCSRFFEYLYRENPRLMKELFNAVINIEIYAREYRLSVHEPNSVIEWFKLFSVFRKEVFGISGEIAWISFLLNSFIKFCTTSDNFIELDMVSGPNWEEQLNVNIKRTTEQIETVLGDSILNTQKNMMHCYSTVNMKQDVFDQKTKVLRDALEQLSKQEEYKGQLNRYFNKKKSGCIALMHFSGKHYVALSGSEYNNQYTKDIEKILGTGYEVVDLNSDVRYYFNKRAYIKYGEYNTWKNKIGFDERKIPEINRMFSCCERKLLTKLYSNKHDNEHNKYIIYVNKKVCNMCDKALKSYDLDYKSKVMIKYPKNYNNSKSNKTKKKLNYKLDEVAKLVKDDMQPDTLFL